MLRAWCCTQLCFQQQRHCRKLTLLSRAAPLAHPTPPPGGCFNPRVSPVPPPSADHPSRLPPSLQLQRPLGGVLLRPGAVPPQRPRGPLPQLPRQHGRSPLRALPAEPLPLGAAGSLPALPLPPRRCVGLRRAGLWLQNPCPSRGWAGRHGFGRSSLIRGLPITPLPVSLPTWGRASGLSGVPAGSLQPQCDSSGTCLCKANVTGWKCERCKDGYHSLSEGGCR